MTKTKQVLVELRKEELLEKMWAADPFVKQMLINSENLEIARDHFFFYLNDLERSYYYIYTDKPYIGMHPVEKNIAKECIRVLKNVIRTENEMLTKGSALKYLYKLAKNRKGALEAVEPGFLSEFLYLFRGIHGNFKLHEKVDLLETNGRKAGEERSRHLDKYSSILLKYYRKMKSGLDQEMIRKQQKMKDKILNYFQATEKDWKDYMWHLKHVIKDLDTLQALITLDPGEIEGLKLAIKYHIPFHITPYYLSLFNESGRTRHDQGLRAMVIPSATYCHNVNQNRLKKTDMDFMGEKSTSPIDAITRRYPQIVILKPLDTCPQICVYCQRNWEIKNINEATVTRTKINKAIEWIKKDPYVTEVLITGGDPLTLKNKTILDIVEAVAEIDHVERIRIGTRTMITLPFRWDQELLDILAKYNEYGRREICIITHFEYAVEITPDVLEVIGRIRKAGMSIYNQEVFTYYNSKKFETAFLRRMMKLSGVDPYYTFNTKGKAETVDFRVPMARLQQERKEEARLQPGIVRTDEPVFNVPKLGKAHLRAWQDHEPVMIKPSGERIYRFYPWESRIAIVDDYLYTDIPIYDYLKRLYLDGEDIRKYMSIWYYF